MANRTDILSVVGVVFALVAIVGGQVLEGGHVGSLVQATAFVIVVGGTAGAVMLQSPLPVFIRGLRMVRWVFRPPEFAPERLVAQVSAWAQLARKEGLLALERHVGEARDPFAAKGLQLLVDGVSPEKLKELLEVEIAAHEDTLRQAARIWESAGGYAPTVGILGAVMGLIHVMENLSDPGKLGAGIAVAFVATIYGVGSANLLLLPIHKKLNAIVARHVVYREMLVDGLLGIAGGENPRVIESRLMGYLA